MPFGLRLPTSDGGESQTRSEKDSDFRAQFEECLDDIQHYGAFSSFQTYNTYVNPGLHLTDYGADIVRIESTEIQCQNPAWASFLDELLQEALEDLGTRFRYSCKARLNAVRLRGTAAVIQPQKQSEAPGLLGTLTISLPSQHTGGGFRLISGGEQESLETASTSAFSLFAAAWYSDVQQEALPVVSGHDLVMIYSLVQDTSLPKQIAGNMHSSLSQLEGLIVKWKDAFSHLKHLVYPLEDGYDFTRLSLQNLSGPDLARGQCLDQVCPRNGICWLLGRLTRRAECINGDIEEDSLLLTNVVTPGGSKDLRLDIMIEDNCLLVGSLFEDQCADSESGFSAYSDDEFLVKHCHHDVLVLMSFEDLFKLFRKWRSQDYSSLKALFQVFKNYRTLHDDPATDELCGEVVRLVLGNAFRALQNPTSVGLAAQVARAKELTILFATVSKYCGLLKHRDWVFESLQSDLKTGKWIASSQCVQVIAREVAIDCVQEMTFQVWDKWLCNQPQLLCRHHLQQCLTVFEFVESELVHPAKALFALWMRSRFESLVRSTEAYGMREALALLWLLPFITLQTYYEITFGVVVVRSSRPTLVHFLKDLYKKASEASGVWDLVLRYTFKHVIRSAKTTLKMTISDITTAHPENNANLPNSFAGVIDFALRLSSGDATLEGIIGYLPDVPQVGQQPEFPKLSPLDFVEKLATVLERPRSTAVTESIRSFILAMLEYIILSAAKSQPTPPNDWKRDTKSDCGCATCGSLNDFLVSPTRAQISLDMSAYRHFLLVLPHAARDYGLAKAKTNNGALQMILSKTQNEYRHFLDIWNSDKKDLDQKLERLNTQFLKNLLGTDICYDTIVEASIGPKAPSQPNGPATAPTQSLAGPHPGAGVKRELDN
ncbi:hypothetical protein BDV96DRAFT_655460 [Lophiotrema nucula]|uniref:Uncharacterized protein n=1 Tax=Lophiotrema nucula TaxID=690887 RepID=A0A6A5YFB1_9PLEO|nr:hypothetical protein BDV96DRAFT_655460 [Lophiotrema nucula]